MTLILKKLLIQRIDSIFVQVQTAASVAKGAETVDVRAVVSAHDFGTALTGLVQILNATGEALHLPTTKIETPGLTAREDWTVQALFNWYRRGHKGRENF